MTPPSVWTRVRSLFTRDSLTPRSQAPTATSSELDAQLGRGVRPAYREEPPQPNAPTASKADDLYSMSNAEFGRHLAADRARDAQYAPTTEPLPRSRLLSRAAEAEAVQIDESGHPNLHLVAVNGQLALAVPNGRLVDRKANSAYRHDVFLIGVRGTSYYEAANLSTETSAGTQLGLRRDPDNEHDKNAIAVVDQGTGEQLGWVNKLNAKRLAKRLDSGEELVVLSLCGSPIGKNGDTLVVLVTRPDILTHLQRAQPPGAPVTSQDEYVNQEWVRIDPDVLAEDRWKAGTPPVHGLSKRVDRAPEVANVRIGQEVQVERTDKHWLVIDDSGVVLGQLRWRGGDAQHSKYPARGVLHVTRLLKENDAVVDFGGYVVPQ